VWQIADVAFSRERGRREQPRSGCTDAGCGQTGETKEGAAIRLDTHDPGS
jgi:hypothetical protein